MAFTPKKKNNIETTIKDYLLKGYIIRYDMRDETPREVMSRSAIESLPHMGNIGDRYYSPRYTMSEIRCSHDLLHNIVDDLKKEYSVRKVFCASCGCCQYSTYGVYLDGEE